MKDLRAHPSPAVQGLGMQEEDDDDEGSQCPSQPRCAGPRLTPGSSRAQGHSGAVDGVPEP